MGTQVTVAGAVWRVVPLLLLGGLLAGCQMGVAAPAEKLVEYREKCDDSGLAPPFTVEDLKASASLPYGWRALRLKGPLKTLLYSHQQWRSPTRRTAVGITYARMPLPLSTDLLVWFAMNEVSKKVHDGRIIRKWTDPIGRKWFEAENCKYHMTGYVMTRGFDAWINYAGYRVTEPKMDGEIALANKALETILPTSVMDGKEDKVAGKDAAGGHPVTASAR